jgi:3-oxo-5alpha-steroid 4-dehydrogenase
LGKPHSEGVTGWTYQLGRARGDVILSTGGYTYNLKMLDRYRPRLAPQYEGLLRLGSMGCDGSGIELGVSAGGATTLMERLFLGSPISPPEAYVEGVIVNSASQRFINEDAYHAKIGNLMADQPGPGKAWLILNRHSFGRALKQALFPGKGMFMMWGAPVLFNVLLGGTRRARTLEKLASKCGIDPAGLRATIGELNEAALNGTPDRHGKAANKLHAIDRAPYYAVNLAIGNRFWPTMMFTLGGLLVDEQSGAVL